MKSNNLAYRIFQVINTIVMIGIFIATVYPFIHIISLSLSAEKYVFSGQVWLLPKEIGLQSYKMIFKHPSFARSYLNSIYYTVFFVVVSLILTTLTAYPLSKDFLPGNKFFKKLVMFTMLFNGGMIPNFLLIKSLHLYNSVWSITLPGAVAAYYVMIMITYFKSLPNDIIEAAAIDGLGDFRIFLKIVLPLSKPIIATMVLFFAVAQWNNWFTPLIYFNKDNKYPVILVLRNLLFNAQQIASDSKTSEALMQSQQQSTGEGIKYSAIVLTTLPFLAIYPFAQKYFVQGMLIGSVKG